jgi:IS30 family transposase
MKHLTQGQRYEISALHTAGHSNIFIAQQIGVNKSTVGREIKRNRDQRSKVYKPDLAQKKAEQRQQNKPKFIKFTPEIKDYVTEKINDDLSPEQIAGRAALKGIPCVSHERIYQFIWDDKKRGGELCEHLRSQGKRYQSRGNTNNKRGQIPDKVHISERPAIVDKKERFGDLEVDLIIGKDHKGALVTINDRATGMLKMIKVDSKESAVVQRAIIGLLQDWKIDLHTITSDNGKEFAGHKEIAKALGIDYYFATPYHSWERGANENLNGLVRQYFPKGSSFVDIEPEKVIEIQNKLNDRPRKKFGYKSPNEVFAQAC